MNIQVANVAIDTALTSDVFVYTIGYEPRCTHIAESLRPTSSTEALAIGYSYSKELGYYDAKQKFHGMGIETVDDVTDKQYDLTIRRLVEARPKTTSIAVDISSMNRARIASWIQLAQRISRRCALSIHFLYSPATFTNPVADLVQNESIGPLSAAFSGYLVDPDKPPELIMGLGYEVGKAIGAAEFLQCSNMWLLMPNSEDQRFEEEVRRVNRLLLEQTDEDHILSYNLDDPAGTYVDICSLLGGVSKWANPILLPLGPKLFSLICMVAGLGFANASVWRASQGVFEVPVAREASGRILGLTVRFGQGIPVDEVG